jgi:hypothetical protein
MVARGDLLNNRCGAQSDRTLVLGRSRSDAAEAGTDAGPLSPAQDEARARGCGPSRAPSLWLYPLARRSRSPFSFPGEKRSW